MDATGCSTFFLATSAGAGVTGIKIVSDLPRRCIEREEAKGLFARMRARRIDEEEARQLGVYLTHGALAWAGSVGLVVAVHCGIIWECWQDLEKNFET